MKPASPPRRDRSLSALVLAFWFLLLALPCAAGWRLAHVCDARLVAGVPAVVSLATYLAYRSDKRRAETGARRLPESVLHLAELLGGWPGAFLAQQRFRHKVVKLSYQLTFWGIVLLHEVVAIDYLTDSGLVRAAGRLLREGLS